MNYQIGLKITAEVEKASERSITDGRLIGINLTSRKA